MRTRHIKRAKGGKKKRDNFKPSPFNFDINNLPELLRLGDICRNARKRYAGIVPLTRSAWLDAVDADLIPPPIRLGAKVIAWPKAVVLDVMKNGIPRGRRGPRAEARAKAHAAEKARKAEGAKRKPIAIKVEADTTIT
jgi:predicted DNA-binding transcriptional regulator AlpA